MTIALSFICLGSYFTVVRNPRFPALLGELAFVNNYLMVSLGILLTIVCVFGFFAISNGKVQLLKWYAILLTICLIIQFGAVAAALCYFQASYAWNADRLTSIMVNEYEEANEKVFNARLGAIIHPSNIYYGGCMAAISDKLKETLFIILVVLLALAAVEFIGVILACCYWRAPKYAYE
nr:unnamed protein product [Spirometra erinaceieuropaei]